MTHLYDNTRATYIKNKITISDAYNKKMPFKLTLHPRVFTDNFTNHTKPR